MAALTSIAQSVEAAIKQEAISAFVPEPAKVEEHQKEGAETPIPEKKDEVAAPAKKTLADISDEPPLEQKKEEADAHQEDAFARKDGEKDSAYIKRLKADLASERNRAKQIEETVAKKTVNNDRVTELEKLLADREEALQQTAYEKTTDYQNRFGKPMSKAEQSAKDMIGKFTDTKGVYERAMALDHNERLEFLKEHTGDAASAIFERTVRVEEIRSERDEAVKDKAAVSKALEEKQRSSLEQETEKILAQFDSTAASMAKRLSALRGDDALAILESAKMLLDGRSSDDEVIQAAIAAQTVPFYIQKVQSLQQELSVYKARDAEREGDSARLNGRGSYDSARNEEGSALRSDGKPKSVKEFIGGQIRQMAGK